MGWINSSTQHATMYVASGRYAGATQFEVDAKMVMMGEERMAVQVQGAAVNMDLMKMIRLAYGEDEFCRWAESPDESSTSSSAFASKDWPLSLRTARSAGSTIQYAILWAIATATCPTANLLSALHPKELLSPLCPCGRLDTIGHWLSCEKSASVRRMQRRLLARDVAGYAMRNNLAGRHTRAELRRELERATAQADEGATARDEASMWMGLSCTLAKLMMKAVPKLDFKGWTQATVTRRLRVLECLHASASMWRPAPIGRGLLR